MVDRLKFRIQLTIVLLFSSLFAYVATAFPASETNYSDVVIEGIMAFSCLFVMFSIESLKESRVIYLILLLSSSLLFMGHFLDVIDEFTIPIEPLDFVEDLFKPSGFLLLLAGCYHWVKFHKKQSKMMRHLADIDPLTGLLNRRAFTEKAELLSDFSYQTAKPVGIIIFDIDHFKQVNDNYGHLFGDQVLTEVASTVKAALRQNDYCARLGGEEFVVLLSDSNTYEATIVAEKIRNSVEKLEITKNQQTIKCTVSLGVVSDGVKNGMILQLIEKADKALYEAKADGRNCWRVAQ